MKAQRICLEDGSLSWCVLGTDQLPIKPIQQFINYLFDLERSPNTLKTYAHHLKVFWEFLVQHQLEWSAIKLEHLAHFVHWSRVSSSNVIPLQESSTKRTESTINAMIAAVTSFYRFHQTSGTAPNLVLYANKWDLNPRYKSYLHHLNRHNLIKTRQIKLKVPTRILKIVNVDQVTQIIQACKTRRDKFLVYLLYESGMRIGQALGLKHVDVKSWDNEIDVVPRFDNPNGARTKSLMANVIHVSQELMALYTDYIVTEYDDIESDYVFVCTQGRWKGKPITYYAVQDLFCRISIQVGFKITPHMLRHTHATELLRNGWDMALIQKRLGHRDIQTTMNTYVHVSNQDLKDAFKSFEKTRKVL